jgi:hypothetical protein
VYYTFIKNIKLLLNFSIKHDTIIYLAVGIDQTILQCRNAEQAYTYIARSYLYVKYISHIVTGEKTSEDVLAISFCTTFLVQNINKVYLQFTQVAVSRHIYTAPQHIL